MSIETCVRDLKPVPLMTSVSLLEPIVGEREATSGVAHGENVNLGRSAFAGAAASPAQVVTTEVTLSQMSPLDAGASLAVNR